MPKPNFTYDRQCLFLAQHFIYDVTEFRGQLTHKEIEEACFNLAEEYQKATESFCFMLRRQIDAKKKK